MRVLVTGAAGFIGSAIVLQLLEDGHEVAGVDNHNDYYDPRLKEARLARHEHHPAYRHFRADVADTQAVRAIFEQTRPQWVVHLAAQAGVRHSLRDPESYVQANLVGFANMLEACRQAEVAHLVYASSSSVYGGNRKIPYAERDNVDRPLSLYAATKKSNELMAHAYSHLYGLPCTGLRFFTVYGPWDRPDMALQKFARRMLAGEPLDIYNNGRHERDWTYIDDVVAAVVGVLELPPAAGEASTEGGEEVPGASTAPWRILNIGRGAPVKLMDVISLLEEMLGVRAQLNFLPLQPGDVVATHADVSALRKLTGFVPKVSMEEGLARFADWFRQWHR